MNEAEETDFFRCPSESKASDRSADDDAARKRVNESSVYRVYEPGHQGSCCRSDSQLPSTVHEGVEHTENLRLSHVSEERIQARYSLGLQQDQK